MMNPQYLAVIRLLIERLDGAGVWALTGSLGMALQGAPVEPHDVDVQTDAAGAYEIERRLAAFVTRPVRFSATEAVRSHFGALRIGGLDVEIIGAIEKCASDGGWLGPPSLARIIRWVTVDDLQVPVLDLEYELAAYRTLGRLDRVRVVERWLAEQRGVEGQGE